MKTEVGTKFNAGAGSSDKYHNKRAITAVIGNLDGLSDLETATAWLKDKLASLHAPLPHKVYAKGPFKGMIFSEFGSVTDRDFAVEALRGAPGCWPAAWIEARMG